MTAAVPGLLAAALVVLAVAALLDLLVRGTGPRRAAPYLVAGAAAGLLAAIGAAATFGADARLGLDSLLGGPSPLGPIGLRIDRLAGLFLLMTMLVAVPVSWSCAAWASRPERLPRRGLGALFCLLLCAVTLVVTADDVFLLLLAWELLTVAFYLLAGWDRAGADRTDAAVITVFLGKVSGAALLLGFLLLAAPTGGFTFDQLAAAPRSGVRDAAFALLVAGFAVKVGLVPFHVWMPRGYCAAPGPLRAAMAGLAVNVGFYGMWRTLDLLRVPPGWLAVATLLVGGLTAVLGIAHAAVGTDLARIVAYSSVENGGLICVGYGIALLGAAVAQPMLVAAGLLAATLQVGTHTLAKSLLFGATSGLEEATGTTALETLRGVAHRLPHSGTGLAVGALTLAGLPVTVGFVSEWFLLEALMQSLRVGRLAYALPLAVTGALVALTAGFAAVAFVRLVGLTVLGAGDGPAPACRGDGELGPLGRAALGLLGFGCVAVAAVAPLWVRTLAAGLDPVVGRDVTAGALQGPWVLGPVYPEFSALSPSWLIVVMPLLLVAVLGVAQVLSGGRLTAVRRTPAWRSATGGVAGESQYTPFGFANPTRKVLANLLLTRSELTGPKRAPGGRTDVPRAITTGRLGYTSDVVDVVEHLVLRPVGRALVVFVGVAKKLQNGRLDAYLLYMLVTVLAVIAVVAAVST